MALIAAAFFAAKLGAAAPIKVGAKLEVLAAGKITYHHVLVRSINARTVLISHDGGMASIALRTLSSELQADFGYNPEAEAAAIAADEAAATARAQREAEATAEKQKAAAKAARPDANVTARLLELRQKFGQKPDVRTEGVDLRSQFSTLSLGIKNQGVRPSCAIFAAVSALEFQNAQLRGQAEQFSEEYLIWATSKLLGRPVRARTAAATDDPVAAQSLDLGFSLSDVATAIRQYGVPLQTELPYQYSRNYAVTEPPAEVVDTAKNRNRIAVTSVPGDDATARLANLVQTLNSGMPVPIGLMWPLPDVIRAGLINVQPASTKGHAVTLVGYRNQTGDIRDTTFIFKNSWGTGWGIGGYGFVTYRYLFVNLRDAVVLDVGATRAR